MKNQKIAKEILELVGGQRNINSLEHCATRLRFALKNKEKVDRERLNSHDDVIIVVESGGQFQVVVGNNVGDVYREMMELMALEHAVVNTGNDVKNHSEQKISLKQLLGKLVDFISGILTPFVGSLAGAGLIKGCLALALNMQWLEKNTGTYLVLFSASEGIFYFLPIVLAITVSRKLNTNLFVSVAIAAAMVYPSITIAAQQPDMSLSFLGLPIILMDYSTSMLPIILVILSQFYIEKLLNRISNDIVKNMLVPFFLIILLVPFVFLVLGPFGAWIASLLAKGYFFIHTLSPLVLGVIIGAFWQLIVVFGVHWVLVFIMLNNLFENGFDTMTPMVLPAVIAQAGAVWAVGIKTRQLKMKALAHTSGYTALLGITEPAVYGITLKLKKPFVCACLGGAIGSGIIGFFEVKSFTFTFTSLLSLPTYLGENSNVLWAIVGVSCAFTVAFLLTYFWGYQQEVLAKTK